MTAFRRDERVQAEAIAALEGLRAGSLSLLYAVVLTDDGFAVTGTAHPRLDPDRFASMSSSMQALGDAVARELAIGTGDHIIIASEHGHVVQLRVPGVPLVLAALFDTAETLGKALAISRRAARELSARLG